MPEYEKIKAKKITGGLMSKKMRKIKKIWVYHLMM